MSNIVYCVRIEGIGDRNGQWIFTSAPLTASDPRYRSWIPSGLRPSLSASEIDPIGGVRTQEELRFSLVDVGDALTSFLGAESAILTRLPVYESAVTDTIAFDDASTFSPGDVIAIGREAIRLESEDTGYGGPGTQWNVTRGWLGTRARNLPARSPVRRVISLAAGRRASFSIVEDGVEGDAETFILDAPQLDETLNVWSFTGRSLERLFDKPTFVPRRSRINWINGDTFHADDARWWPHYGQRCYLKIGDEIVRVEKPYESAAFRVEARGVGGTKVGEINVGDEITEVFTADETEPDEYRSFRWSPTATYAQAFAPTTHPVPIMLAIATSGNAALGYTNGNATIGYFACLPYGLGIEIDQIDRSWREVWERTPRASLPRFVLEAGTIRELFVRIARYCGYFVFWSGGKLCCASNAVETPTDQIVVSDMATRDRLPALGTPVFSTDWLTSRVEIQGIDTSSFFGRADFGAEFGFDAELGDDEEYQSAIEAPWLALAASEPQFARERALSLLRGFSRPLWVVEISVPFDWRSRLRFGQIVRWSYSQFPDFETGSRGTSSQYWRVLGRTIDLEACTVTFRLLSRGAVYPEALISPSASITSIASAPTYSCVANRYTDPDNELDLPETDVEAFELGDVVCAQSRYGQVIATTPAYASVVGIGSNTLTLSASLAGAAAGDVIVFVASANATQRQLQNAVYLDAAQRLFGSE